MNIPIEAWYAIGAAVVTLVVSAAHNRGYRLPLLEAVLDMIHPRPPAGKEAVTLERILEEIQKRPAA